MSNDVNYRFTCWSRCCSLY